MDEQMKLVLRRSFLELAAGTGMALSLGGCWLLEPSRPEAGRCVTRGTVPDTDFDYIVIGSGAGGGPVAANLADAGYTVLLLEAGGEQGDANYSVPAFHPFSTEGQKLQWNYFIRDYANDYRQNKETQRDKEGKGKWDPRGGA